MPFARLARWAYSLLLYLAAPLVALRLLLRARRQPEYRDHWGERWGFYGDRPPWFGHVPPPLIWLHAVSVGETRAAQPLVRALLDAYPDHHLLLTGMTPTGRATAREMWADQGHRVHYVYAPYDFPGAVARFFRHFRPVLGLFMETELWPNLLAAGHRAGVPLVLVNARLSARSAAGYARLPLLFRPTFGLLSAVAAQTELDGGRLAALGADPVTVCGNLKFDVTPGEDKLALGRTWKAALGDRPVWLAASTRDGEEALVLDAFERLAIPGLLLLLVPRHPQRFDAVADLVAQRGLSLVRRSQGLPGPETRVWLGDSLGEMPAYYTCADLALIGGSLLPFGGQNLIEAAACGCPVLVGPHTFNFAQAAADAVACGAARRLPGAEALGHEVGGLFRQPEARRAMALAAQAFAAAHRGATARTLALIADVLGQGR